MKANEMPEKIYLDEDESWHLTNPNGDSVEYTRTDYAEKNFIAIAQRWLAEIHRVCDITDENGYRIELRELQARFENYMKGE